MLLNLYFLCSGSLFLLLSFYICQLHCTVKPAHAVTCIKRSPFSCPVIENFIWIEPLLRGHLYSKVTFSLSQLWPLNTGLTISFYWLHLGIFKMSFMFIIVLFFCHWIITAWFGWVLANVHLPAMVSLSSWKLYDWQMFCYSIVGSEWRCIFYLISIYCREMQKILENCIQTVVFKLDDESSHWSNHQCCSVRPRITCLESATLPVRCRHPV